jgi:hypothetical protein
MAYARRVIFSTYVVPTQSVEMEETSVRQAEFQPSPNGVLGGNGVATINATQWGDDWTSMEHDKIQLWEDFTTVVWEELTGNWESGSGGQVTITTTGANHQLSDDSNDLAFLYIKNTGDTNNALVSLNGSSGNYYIIIPPEGSVHLRGDGTALDCNDVYVKSSASTTTIEYIIAKE